MIGLYGYYFDHKENKVYGKIVGEYLRLVRWNANHGIAMTNETWIVLKINEGKFVNIDADKFKCTSDRHE